MSIIKLQKGQRVHLTVGAVTPVESQYGPEYRISGATPEDSDATLFLKTTTVERQLARIGLDIASIVGQTVEIAKPDKYIDINRASGNTAPVASPAAPAPAPNGKQGFTSGPHIPGLDDASTDAASAKVEQLKKLASLHKRCLQFVLEEEAPMLAKSDVGDSPESVSARTAQLFIAATNAGLHR